MTFKIIVAGCTGSAGSEALRQALLDSRITQVTCLTRRPPSAQFTSNPKLKVIIHNDFNEYPKEVLSELSGHDGVIWALGITYKGPDSIYRQVMVQYPVAAAKAFSTLSTDPKKKFVFAFVTNMFADQEAEEDKPNYIRIRGEAEKALCSLNIATLVTYIFRPGMIGLVSPVPELPLATRITASFVLLARHLVPQFEIHSDTLAKGMIASIIEGSGGSLKGWEGKGEVGNKGAFENEEIKKLAQWDWTK